MQALHPVGHAAGGDAGDLRHVLDRLAAGQVVLVGRRDSARPGRGPRPAGRSSRASARPTPAGCTPAPPAGRSGRTASGTACRRAAAAWSRPRRAGRTGSGARPRACPAGRGRAARATTARSVGSLIAVHSRHARCRRFSTLDHRCCPTSGLPGSGGCVRLARGRRPAAAASASGQTMTYGFSPGSTMWNRLRAWLGCTPCPSTSPPVPPGRRSARSGRPGCLQPCDLGLLGEVDPQRVGVGQQQRQQHQAEHDRAAGDAGAAAARTVRLAAPPRRTRAPAWRPRRAGAPARPPCRRRAGRTRAGRAARAGGRAPRTPGLARRLHAGAPRGRPAASRKRLANIQPANGTAGTRRPRRTAPRRRAPPRCAAAGCTWPPARTGPGHRS